MAFGALLSPGGPPLFDAADADGGGAEVLAESLIFAAPNGAFFGPKLSTIQRTKSQPKKSVSQRRRSGSGVWSTGTAPGATMDGDYGTYGTYILGA